MDKTNTHKDASKHFIIWEAAREVVNSGYVIANDMQVRQASVDFVSDFEGVSKGFGILKDSVQSQNSGVIAKLLRNKPRAEYVGELWFEGKDATLDNWVMTVMREANAVELNELADGLSKKFGVRIEVRQQSEAMPRYETTEAENGALCQMVLGE